MWISIALVAILLAAASSDRLRPPRHGCRVGAVMMRDCNTCICDDSRTWACTGLVCPRTKRETTCSSEEMENPTVKCACVQKGHGSAEDKALCLAEEAVEKLRLERANVSPEVEQACQPGTTFAKDCNTQGTSAVCTEKNSSEGLRLERANDSTEVEQACQPGTTFAKDCNRCLCNTQGTRALCTAKDCSEGLRLERENVATEVEQACQPGTTFAKDCNTCLCNTHGTSALCTQRDCSQGLQPQRVKRAIIWPWVCPPARTYMKDCNVCRCNALGTEEVCTHNKCYAVCRPGQVVHKNCVMCICVAGKWKCTKYRHCVPKNKLVLCPKSEEDEEEGERFKRDVGTVTSKQPTVCLSPKVDTGGCNTCNPQKPISRPILGPMQTTTPRPMQPVCLPPKVFSKDCNTCHTYRHRGSYNSDNQQHFPYDQEQINIPPIHTPTLPRQRPLPTINSRDSHKKIHIPPIPPHQPPPSVPSSRR